MRAFVKIEADGIVVQGFNTVMTVAGQDVTEFIELISFGVGMDRDFSSSGMATGTPKFRALTLVKRLDKASPLLLKALSHNEVVTAEVRAFGPDPAGTGTDSEHFRIKIEEGRVRSVDWDGTTDAPAVETVEIVYGRLEATEPASGTSTIVSRSSTD